MAYKDLVLGTNGETSVLVGGQPDGYWACDVSGSNEPNLGDGAAKSLNDNDLSVVAESLTLDSGGAPNSAGSMQFNNGGENLQNWPSMKNGNQLYYNIGMWIKPDLSADQLLTPTILWAQYNNPNGFTFGLFPGGGLVFSYHRNANDGNGAAAIGSVAQNGVRKFVFGTFSFPDNRIRLYEDGVLVSEGVVGPGNVKAASADMRLGNSVTTKIGTPTASAGFTGGSYNGLMAHIIADNDREFTPAEIAALYAAGAGPQGATLTLTGLQPGSDVVIKDPSITSNGADNNIVQRFGDISGTSQTWTYSSAPPTIDIEIYRTGFKIFTLRNIPTGSDATLPISQQFDPAYGA